MDKRLLNEGPEWKWLDRIKVGDVLLFNGKPRVVREVVYHGDDDRLGRFGKLVAVSFTIKNRSKTGRCYTVMCRADLKTKKAQHSGWRKLTMSLKDKWIAHDIKYDAKGKQRLNPDLVKGID